MNRTRREFLKTVGIGTAALSIPQLFSSCGTSKQRPNILFIMSDDHAEQAISCYGSNLIQTPNIDRIAHEGVRFKNSFVTNSICAPSRAVLLTGKYSHKNGLRDNRDEFDGNQVTFPKLLQQHGYQTYMIGKWHLKTDPTGFDSWKILIDQGQYFNPEFIENGERKEYIGYTTDIITDMALKQLEARRSDAPFCMFVHHKAPHRNWMPNFKYLDNYSDEDLPLPETFYDDYSTRSAAAREADMRIDDMYLSTDMKLNEGSYERETGSGGSETYAKNAPADWQAQRARFTEQQLKMWDAHYDRVNREFKDKKLEGRALLEWKYQRYIKDYLRCIMSVEESVGRLLDYLDDQGLADSTLVVYTSDQGFYLGEHGWYDKRFMYEESLSMPLLMRYPKHIEPGLVSDDIVLNLDFAPTFLHYADVKVPSDMQGESMKPLLTSTTPNKWRKSMYYHYYEYPHGWHDVKKHYGVRTDRYKLIHFYDDIDAWELYDLQEDPNELNNVYSDPKYDSVVVSLKEELNRLRIKYDDE
ncbi:sulfatase [candidate division KSB1 bacterium]|nr:sulfatase [candidate division KSB1 bacterium]